MNTGLRFVILNTDYPEFLGWLYTQRPGLEKQSYEEQIQFRMESLFGVADFYSSNLRKLGHEGWDIHANNEFMQKAWAREHGIRIEEMTPAQQCAKAVLQRARRVAARMRLRYLKPLFRPVLRSLDNEQAWFYDILSAQIKRYKPDVLLNQNIGLSSQFLQEIKPHTRLLVGQHASPVPEGQDLSVYDLMISSLPNFVYHFIRQGVPSELHRFGFEPAVLERLGEVKESISVSFVGSLFHSHASRRRWLDYVRQGVHVEVWGQGVNGLLKESPVISCYPGTAWGLEMYRILQRSQITLNHHIDVAESYANNMRLFEATGVGTLLITDWKKNLHEMFNSGKEVVAYRNPEECIEFIQYYLEHDEERKAIARAGQERTLREHNYYQRMQELVDIVRKFL
jgi:hypothetical protein